MNKGLFVVLSLLFLSTSLAFANESTVEISGDYRFRYDILSADIHEYTQLVPSGMAGGAPGGAPVPAYTVKNNSLMTNRFGVNLKATPLEDVSVKARFIMYKIYGHQTADPGLGYFGDRNSMFGTNDGTVGHIPEDNVIRADYAYATVSYVFNQPMWVSVGRRPSTGGIPGNYRQNSDKQGTAGIPSIMVNYAFDGYTIGYVPDIEMLPGAYVKFCGGKGYDSGYNGLYTMKPYTKDTDFYGLNVVPYDVDSLHVELQYQVGKNIFDRPSDAGVQANLGDLSWYGGAVTSDLGNLHLFASAAVSKSDPNDNLGVYDFDGDGIPDGMGGLLYNPGSPAESETGTAIYVGGRYDFSTGTKVGLEYNQGSKNWVSMVPADDDIITSKLGTRGKVYEMYIIQELNRKPHSKKGKAFVKIGYQQYDFEYTGSNFWIGAPAKISDLRATTDPNQGNFFAAVDKATDIYATFEVQF